jgi:hypothetical protein
MPPPTGRGSTTLHPTGSIGQPTRGRSAFGEAASALPVSPPALTTPAIVVVGNILQPLAPRLRTDPAHFAMIGIVSPAFGLLTPP